jgi:putative addiction module component (TIGR02574 family)
MAHPAYDLDRLRQLSVPERLQLVEDLWDTIAADAPDAALRVTPDLAAELDRRLAEHDANPEAVVPWETVRAALMARYRRP